MRTKFNIYVFIMEDLSFTFLLCSNEITILITRYNALYLFVPIKLGQPLTFLEVYVPCLESEMSCVLWVSIGSLFLRFFNEILDLFRQCRNSCFSFDPLTNCFCFGFL